MGGSKSKSTDKKNEVEALTKKIEEEKKENKTFEAEMKKYEAVLTRRFEAEKKEYEAELTRKFEEEKKMNEVAFDQRHQQLMIQSNLKSAGSHFVTFVFGFSLSMWILRSTFRL